MSLLHVANGHATTGLIELANLPGRTMVWCDPLHDGPVPGGLSDDELIRVRAGHLCRPGETLDDVVADLRHWRSASRASSMWIAYSRSSAMLML